MKNKKPLLIVVLLLVVYVMAGYSNQTTTTDGHVHGDECTHATEKMVKLEEHGEPIKKIDEHAGHDHSKHAGETTVDPHAGHAHEQQVTPTVDPHAGHDHGTNKVEVDPHAGHNHSAEEEDSSLVVMSKVEQEKIQLKLCKVASGTLARSVVLPGNIRFNQDRLVHIVPRVAGIVRSVNVTLGSQVKKGDVLAVLESQELAEVKSTFLVAREKLRLAEKTFTREEKLREKGVNSASDFQEAENGLQEARIDLWAARQKLRILDIDIAKVEAIEMNHDVTLMNYPIVAVSDGVVVEKHIVSGEVVTTETDVFQLADLSNVWVDLSVYERDLMSIQKGQMVTVSALEGVLAGSGVIDYISVNVKEETRAGLARVVMQNPGNLFRAGLFVTATVWLGGEEESVIIPASAVQQLQGMPVVFVPNGNAFKIREIKTGRRYRGHIAVTAGLKVGEMIVDKGSFELKAKQLTSGLDPHAGHGH